MDLSVLQTTGVAGVLLVVIGYLLRQNHQDRTQYRDDVAAIDARHRKEAENREDRYAAEMAGLKQEISDLKDVNIRALAELEAERRRRWAAEDAAAHYRQLAEKGLPRE